MIDQLISWSALLFSGIAILIALRVQRRQPELIAKQIAELDRGARERHEARLVARLERMNSWAGARGLSEIRILNEGPAEARDIDLRFPDGNSPIPPDEARDKLPVPVLQPRGRFDLVAALSHDAAPPFHVILTWRDGRGPQVQETTLM
jgi:hypothetical protein